MYPLQALYYSQKTIDPTVVQKELTQCWQQQKIYYDQHTKPLKQLKTGDSILVSAKDDKWKPAKVTGINENGPCSYSIVTPQGQHYRRNRKDLTSPVNNNTTVDDFLDDQEYDCDASEPVVESPRAYEPQPPAALATTLRCSQRTIKTPVWYADQFS